jgi:2-keto-4-pentenoate hydratase/2-oxohepta-3-ene-1,7-dioic acid hydratase in catechol pathway
MKPWAALHKLECAMLNLVRFEKSSQTYWGIYHQNRVFQLEVPCTTTKALLQLGRDEIKQLAGQALYETAITAYKLLSPITQDAKVLCQGANYRQHMIDSGMNPNDKRFNMFFTKSAASITTPQGSIIKPKKVALLDYEVELTLVLGASTQAQHTITDDNISQFVAGICIGNDVSARDIQIPQMQFHKGKSYRTFCPLGPYLVLLEDDEFHYLHDLDLTLSVNGEVRQQDNTRNLVFKPAETLSEFSQVVNYEPGDVLMTGTPSGCALGLPSPFIVKLVGILPEGKKWRLF